MYKYIIQIFFKKTTTYKFKNPVLLSLKEVNKTNPFPASLLPVTFVTYLWTLEHHVVGCAELVFEIMIIKYS